MKHYLKYIIIILFLSVNLYAASTVGPSDIVQLNPTTIPATGNAGGIRYDSSSSTLKFHNGSSWAAIGGAGGTPTVSTKTAASFTASTDNLYLIDSTSNDVTANLPTAASIAGEIILFKVINNTNSFIADGSGSETIDDGLTFELNGDDEFIAIRSDGTNWKIIQSHFNQRVEVEATTDTPTTVVNTWTTVTGMSLIVTPGRWLCGYNASGRLDENTASLNTMHASIRSYDSTGTAAIAKSYSAFGKISVEAARQITFPFSARFEFVTTVDSTIILEIACSDANAAGNCWFDDEETTTAITGTDNTSTFYCERLQ